MIKLFLIAGCFFAALIAPAHVGHKHQQPQTKLVVSYEGYKQGDHTISVNHLDLQTPYVYPYNDRSRGYMSKALPW